MHKAKNEDFRMEEELRSQKAKYEEMSEDVYRRMQDVSFNKSVGINNHSSFTDQRSGGRQRGRFGCIS